MPIDCLPRKESLAYLKEEIPDILVDVHKELHGKPFTPCFDGKTVIAAGREHYILGRNEEFIVICPIETVADGCAWGEPRVIRDVEYLAAKQRAIREARQLHDAREGWSGRIIGGVIVGLTLLLAQTVYNNNVSPPHKEKKSKDPPPQKAPIEPSVQKRPDLLYWSPRNSSEGNGGASVNQAP